MLIVKIIFLLFTMFIVFYVFADLFLTVYNIKYQKLWNKQKAMLIRVDPMITRAELCEEYVMFCKRNNCKVEF